MSVEQSTHEAPEFQKPFEASPKLERSKLVEALGKALEKPNALKEVTKLMLQEFSKPEYTPQNVLTSVHDIFKTYGEKLHPPEKNFNNFAILLGEDFVKLLQIKLVALGMNIGKFGKNKDGVDGKLGRFTGLGLNEFFKQEKDKKEEHIDPAIAASWGPEKLDPEKESPLPEAKLPPAVPPKPTPAPVPSRPLSQREKDNKSPSGAPPSIPPKYPPAKKESPRVPKSAPVPTLEELRQKAEAEGRSPEEIALWENLTRPYERGEGKPTWTQREDRIGKNGEKIPGLANQIREIYRESETNFSVVNQRYYFKLEGLSLKDSFDKFIIKEDPNPLKPPHTPITFLGREIVGGVKAWDLPALMAAQDEIQRSNNGLGLNYQPAIKIGGAEFRGMRVDGKETDTPSTHCLGALDLDGGDNNRKDGRGNIPDQVFRILAKYGFATGAAGDEGFSEIDGDMMHIQGRWHPDRPAYQAMIASSPVAQLYYNAIVNKYPRPQPIRRGEDSPIYGLPPKKRRNIS